MAEPYHARLRRLRAAAGLSQPSLFRLVDNLSLDTVRALERDPATHGGTSYGKARYPSADALAKLAAALGVPAEDFPEYRLAKARELLDERQVDGGLDRALANLAELIDGLDALATERLANGGEPPALLRHLRPASAGEPPSAQGEA